MKPLFVRCALSPTTMWDLEKKENDDGQQGETNTTAAKSTPAKNADANPEPAKKASPTAAKSTPVKSAGSAEGTPAKKAGAGTGASGRRSTRP